MPCCAHCNARELLPLLWPHSLCIGQTCHCDLIINIILICYTAPQLPDRSCSLL
jgi:hypothetical protein